VQGNLIHDNDRDGVKIRNSWNISVAANDISSNDGVGVNAYVGKIEATSGLRDFVLDPYVPFTNFDLDGNSIINNGGGLRTSGVAGFSVFGSNFGPQRLRLTSGDIKGIEGYMLQSAATGAAVISRACAVDDPRASCALPPHQRDIAFGGNGITNCLPWHDNAAASAVATEVSEE
jgi:poly(beta-D-mannuronate) C5 epimerase